MTDLIPAARPVPSPDDRMRDARTDREYADRIPAPRPLTTDRTNSHHRDLHQHIAGLENDLRSQTRAVLEVTAERDRHRQELGAAGEVLAVVRDAAERIDRALAVYDTTPGGHDDLREIRATNATLAVALHTDALAHRAFQDQIERYADQLRDDAKTAEDGIAVGLLRAADGMGDLLSSTALPPSSVPPRRVQGEPACTCYPSGFSPGTYEGPMRDCPVHGELSAKARP